MLWLQRTVPPGFERVAPVFAQAPALLFSGWGCVPRSMRYQRYLAAACLLLCFAGWLPARAQSVPDRQVIHLLNRLAFGPTLEDVGHVKAIGADRYIAEQLAPEAIPEPLELNWRLGALETLRYNAVQLRGLF